MLDGSIARIFRTAVRRTRLSAWTLVGSCVLIGLSPLALGGEGAEDAWWSLFDQAAVLRDAHAYEDASSAFVRAEQFAVANRLDPNYVKASIAGQIECCHAVFDYVGLRDLSLHMLEVARASGPSEDVFDTLLDLGYFETQLGDPVQAMLWLEGAADLVGDQPARAADVDLRIALTQTSRGHYAHALEAGERAERYFRRVDDDGNLVSSLSILGRIYTALDEHEKALACIEKAKAIASDEDAVTCADLLTSLGTLRAGAGDLTEARAAYAEARGLYESHNERLATANVMCLDARILDREGELEQALAGYETALALAGPASPVSTGMQVMIAWSLSRLGRRDEARTHLQSCCKMAAERGDLPDVACAAALLAQDHVRRGEHDEACARMRDSLDALAGLSAGLSPLTRASALAGSRFALARVEEVAFGLADASASLQLFDRTRATTITAGIGRVAAASPNSSHQLEDARERVAAALSSRCAAEAHGKLALIRPAEQAYREALVAYRDALRREQRGDQAARCRGGEEALSLEAVQDMLRPEDALVLYAFLGEELRAFVVEKEAVRRVDVAAASDLRPLVEQARTAMRGPGELPASAPLAEVLIGKLALSDGVTRLLVSPDDVLAGVPFAWIAGEREVVFVPSATAYGLLQEEKQWHGEGVLAMADPAYAGVPGGLAPGLRAGLLSRLEHSRDEARAITGKKDVLLLGEDATEEALRRALPGRERWHSIHFACHGLLDEQQPAWSSLALTSSEKEDGLLSVIEIMGMRFPTDLAVLSACDTGLGPRIAGEGMLGLASAFLYAGAPRVVASLWKVDDEATEAFMRAFYEAWNPEPPSATKGAAEALRIAREALQDSERWSHPHYWAAWVLWGLPD